MEKIIEEFKKSDMLGQVKILLEEGTYLAGKEFGVFKTSLISLDKFIFEVWFDSINKRYHEVKLIEDTAILNNYMNFDIEKLY